MPDPRRAAVLGSPIEHSLSPVLHTAAYAALGLADWTYTAIECDEAGLPALLASRDRQWAGLSLTMPLKRAVLPLLDSTEDLALEVGAANTVLFTDGRRLGYNTDVGGILTALREAGVEREAIFEALKVAAIVAGVAQAITTAETLAAAG